MGTVSLDLTCLAPQSISNCMLVLSLLSPVEICEEKLRRVLRDLLQFSSTRTVIRLDQLVD